jgi:hypothetical protein
VTDKYRLLGKKSRIAEYMVRMHMRIDDVKNGKRRYGAHGFQQALSNTQATAAVDDGHAFFAHDETDVANIPVIALIEVLMHAAMHINTWRSFLHRQGIGMGHAGYEERKKQHQQLMHKVLGNGVMGILRGGDIMPFKLDCRLAARFLPDQLALSAKGKKVYISAGTPDAMGNV